MLARNAQQYLRRSDPGRGGPDESVHIQYVQVLVDTKRLPLMPGTATDGEKARECPQTQHPPLYYLLLTPAYAASLGRLDHNRIAVVLRFVSMLMVLTAAMAIWVAGRLVWAHSRWPAAVAVSFFSLLPETQYMGSLVNNSSGALMANAIAILLCLRVMRNRGVPRGHWLLLGVAITCTLCMKLTSLWVLLLATICIAARLRANQVASKERLLTWSSAALPLLLLLGPWLLRNHLLFDTFVPERVTTRRMFAGDVSVLFFYPEYALELVRAGIPEILLSFASPYWLLRTEYPPATALRVTLVFLLPALVGLVAHGWHRVTSHERPSLRLFSTFWTALALSMVAGTCLVLYMCVRDWNVLVFAGRYAWEGASAIALLWTLGMLSVPSRAFRPALITCVLLGMAGMSLWVCDWVLRFYHVAPVFP